MKVLVINAGSSSLKAQFMDTESAKVYCNINCQRVGVGNSFITYKVNGQKSDIPCEMNNHTEAFQAVLDTMLDKKIGVISSLDEIKAIGHRMVNFGEKYNHSIVITKEVFEDLKTRISFSPLHNTGALAGVEACLKLMPNLKNVAVFDTAFHSTMSEKAYIYAIPYELYTENHIRRYGAHGTSHRFIAMECEKLLGGLEGKKIISCHLGSGSSICAIKDGKCIDTSMGFTPLAGVVMGTRSGDLDPSAVKAIMEAKNLNIDEATDLLNKQSGLIGLSGGYSDMRDIDAHLDEPRVKLAFDVMVYSIKKYIGAYAASMNGLDCLCFTAGIGETDELVRSAVCKDMDYLGIELDEEKNVSIPRRGDIELISTPNSKVKVYRIPTDEEFVIALDTEKLAK